MEHYNFHVSSTIPFTRHCSYDSGYEPIYAPTFTISFIFLDEEEYEEDDVAPSSSIVIYEAESKK